MGTLRPKYLLYGYMEPLAQLRNMVERGALPATGAGCNLFSNPATHPLGLEYALKKEYTLNYRICFK